MTSNSAHPDDNPDVEYFQQLADGAPIMIWMSGIDMGCFYFNRAWLEFRGRPLSEEEGNGWAEGVHPDDLERCIQHYLSSFQKRVSFAMTYRLQHHSGEFRWILDRGAPHFSVTGEFLGFFGGCAETHANAALTRIAELRHALNDMRQFAERVGTREAENTRELAARQNAAAQLGQLASDMLTYDRIENGVCVR